MDMKFLSYMYVTEWFTITLQWLNYGTSNIIMSFLSEKVNLIRAQATTIYLNGLKSNYRFHFWCYKPNFIKLDIQVYIGGVHNILFDHSDLTNRLVKDFKIALSIRVDR